MITNLREYASFLIRHRITPDQYFLLMLLHSGDMATLMRYVAEGKPADPDGVNAFRYEDMQDLINRELVTNLNTDGSQNPEYFVVDPALMDELLADRNYSYGDEFWDEFPDYPTMNGKVFTGKSCIKEKFKADYYAKIGHSKKKHEQVMEVLKYAKLNGLVMMGIEKWIGSEQWKQIAQQQSRMAARPVPRNERIL